jgi:hypothetical protein
MNREKYFFNSTKLPEGEKKYYNKIRPILEGLLNDLKKKKCLRRATREETIHLIKIMRDKDEIALSLNMLNRIFKSKEELQKFLTIAKDYFTDSNLAYLYVSQLYFQFLVSTELFRVFLLFYLKRGKEHEFKDTMTLRSFLDALKRVSPKYGKLIEDEIDIKLRNSFAHGLFRIVGQTFIYYMNVGELKKPISIQLHELWIKMKNHNLIYHCLVQLVTEKMKEGFFENT